MSAQDKAREFASASGYDSVEFVCAWNGAEAYDFYNEAAPDDDSGLPRFIIATASDARMSTTDEAFAIIETLPE